MQKNCLRRSAFATTGFPLLAKPPLHRCATRFGTDSRMWEKDPDCHEPYCRPDPASQQLGIRSNWSLPVMNSILRQLVEPWCPRSKSGQKPSTRSTTLFLSISWFSYPVRHTDCSFLRLFFHFFTQTLEGPQIFCEDSFTHAPDPFSHRARHRA